ncbi:MAG TPA: glycoside hydrolase family 2 protein [Balneolales bacterium]|nr:glycoside hydrolase family 2 protein [Balneolales bacterium]
MEKKHDSKTGMSRGEFLKLASGLTASIALTGFKPVGRGKWATENLITQTHTHSLDGDMWVLHEENSADKLPAVVPGTNYGDLLRHGRLPDPSFRENNDEVQWVADKNWVYERDFDVSQDLLANDNVQLVCHGLDTLSTIWINGKQVAETNNMFRTWTIDVKKYLKTGSNTIRIRFEKLGPYIEEHEKSYDQKYGIDLKEARSWVRKGPYMWGWDWCRPILTMGIWKKIELIAFDARITDVGVLQDHQKSGDVALDVLTSLAGAKGKSLHMAIRVTRQGQQVAQWNGSVSGNSQQTKLTIKNPELWWPNGMGDQPLYEVDVQLRDSSGSVIDSRRERVGLREVEVHSPKDGVAMHISVNGVPVFAKGANWIPADNIPTRVTPEILRSYMKDAADCNFNFIRLWGGGYYEEDALYDACDELGLMLQFEFKFANTTYPIHDKEWIQNLQAEVEDQVKRCRNHPAIVIWSGNNEIQNFKGYNYLFHDVIGGLVHKLVPGAFYEVGSGAEGSGDIHSWNVWHGMKPFENYLKIHGFVTEFGMQSFTHPMTVDSYTDPTDRTSIYSKVIGYHEMSYGPKGIDRLAHYITDNFGPLSENFEHNVWLSQIMQAWGIQMGVEHWRRDMPHSMAAAIWQLNDCWPGPTWSMIDWNHHWKALQYHSRHFFAPVLVSGLADDKTGNVDLYVINEKQSDVPSILSWVVSDIDGSVVTKGSKSVTVSKGTSQVAHSLDLSDAINLHGRANLIVWPKLTYDAGKETSQNMVLLNRPKDMSLLKPGLSVKVSGSEQHYKVNIQADKPALWVWLDVENTDARYSDNFVHIRPDEPFDIDISLDQPVSIDEFRDRLKIHSVYDVAPGVRG